MVYDPHREPKSKKACSLFRSRLLNYRETLIATSFRKHLSSMTCFDDIFGPKQVRFSCFGPIMR